MIRFCDKEVYNVTEGDMTRTQLLMFFLQNNETRKSIISIYQKNGNYKGIITYKDLLEHEELEESINTDVIKITENFWEEAREYFECKARQMLTVVNQNGNILGFVYNDDNVSYDSIEFVLMALKDADVTLPEGFQRVQMAVITDLNELAWRCYGLFKQAGLEVCVIGEKWEWFGFKSGEGYLEYPDYAKLYIYAEGTYILRKEVEQGYYVDVSKNFSFINGIEKVNTETIYYKVLEQLKEKGGTVCECSLPMAEEIQKKTVDEEQSIKLELEMDDYITDSDTFTDEKKNCLWNIYGMENAIVYKYNGNENAIDIVPLGEFQGKTLKGVRYNKRCYLLGCCIVAGYGCLEYETLYGQLQKLLDKFEYQVIAVFLRSWRFDGWTNCIRQLPIREKDIILNINCSEWFSKKSEVCLRLDLRTVYEKEKRENIFCRHTLHTNSEGNRLIAEEIMRQYLAAKINELTGKKSNRYIQKGELLNQDGIKSVEEYVNEICVSGGVKGKIGAIVMNCNPFTKGHRFLIEYASKVVELLYVFVVEEDKSYFKFDDRLLMVKKGTKDIHNVVVVPSGEWVLSYKTMPIYFGKEEMQEMKVDAKLDLEIFARYIAPKLGIVKRFIGEEPLDKITRQYNEQICEILPLFDIEVEEVPRLMIKEVVVSASEVRECIKAGNWIKLSRLVPESTYEMCRKYSLQCDGR